MRAVKVFGASVLAMLTLAAFASGAQAMKLILKSGGQVVPAGTGAVGVLRFGPCGALTSTGTLTNNEGMMDKASFSSFETAIGGCGEGGPTIEGKLENITLSTNGMFTAKGTISYKTSLQKKCEYSLTKLKGKFTIPGPTKTVLSGGAKRVKANSEHGCKGALKVSMVEATLEDQESGQPFEAEL